MRADYLFYQGEYLGTVSEDEFSRLAIRAGAEINRLTMGRAATATGADLEAVKMAECAVIDELYHIAQGGDITSETNDGISRSFASGGVVLSKAQRITAAASPWLSGTNMLFVGV